MRLATRLLGAHILGSPDGDTGLGYPFRSRYGVDLRDPEIGQQGVSVGEQDVLGLHVPMDEPVAMRVVEPGTDFLRDPQRLFDSQLSLDVQALAERPARDERLHVVEHAVRLARVDERHDVGMGESRGDANFLQEPLGAERHRKARPQDLNGDLPAVLLVFGQVNGRHAPAPELPLDRIPVGERGGERGEHLGHGDNGADGIRTHDPLVANQVLSQLSYRPEREGR